ncbi:MAG: hypothetical protein MZW92_04910 [Comamonadaceae bacterium]|nr:hypothetical protein [Comamonadaceae bacterium]
MRFCLRAHRPLQAAEALRLRRRTAEERHRQGAEARAARRARGTRSGAD